MALRSEAYVTDIGNVVVVVVILAWAAREVIERLNA